MRTDNEFEFYQKVVKASTNSQRAGCGCGCLTGLVVVASIIASIFSTSKPFDKIGEEWQKINPDAQKVIRTKRPYHDIQRSNGRQRN